MPRFLFLISLLFTLLLTGCGSKNLLQDSYIVKERDAHQKKYHASKNYFNSRFEYRIQPHDRLKIAVYKHGDLSGSGVLVDSQGSVLLPLVGTVHLAGLTQAQAGRKLTRLYRTYIKRSFTRVETQSKHAYVIGEVRSPGVVPLPNEEMPLLSLIATRGGFRDTANRSKVLVLRSVGRGTRADVVDLTNLTSLSYAGMMVHPNDIVYVVPTGLKNFQVNILPVFQMAATIMSPFALLKSLSGSGSSGTTILPSSSMTAR